MQANEMQQHRTSGKNARRGGATVAAAASLGLLIVLGGCSSGAAGQGNVPSTQATPTATPQTTTSPIASSTPSAVPSPSTQGQDPQADAYWFTVTKRFTGGAQWTVTVRPPIDPTALGLDSKGQAEFDGPNQAVILFDYPIPAQYDTVMDEINADLTERQITQDSAPQSMGLGGVPAAIGSGLNSNGMHVDLITARKDKNHDYTDVTLTCAPADVTADRAALQDLLHSFRFEN
ncbi:hypothetical protein [Demequina lutea]|uniref:Uncharacterized protein n=1 Tax=Demequina lutea TaxID=431489 RepID=A0A7Y9ZBV4_9MICO|nr:hypothetical protein [Demequina lutea]NYI41288.1 hypothetical protein [Demequina lutea]